MALTCADEVPDKDGVESLPLAPYYKTGRAILKNDVYVGSFQRVEREFARLRVQGRFRFGPVSLRATDPMGMEETKVVVDTVDTGGIPPALACGRIGSAPKGSYRRNTRSWLDKPGSNADSRYQAILSRYPLNQVAESNGKISPSKPK